MGMKQDSIALDNFEGPLDFLLQLIRKSEIDISDVSIQEITRQYLERLERWVNPCINSGAEFIGGTAFLLWLKSRMLLPRHAIEVDDEELLDPQFEIIHQLIDYCRFKEVAKELVVLEEQQSVHHPRGETPLPEAPSPGPGVDHLTIDDLAAYFQKTLARTGHDKGLIHEEEWRVGDKIEAIRHLLEEGEQISLDLLFTPEKSRGELIVTFLAILELMKIGELCIMREGETGIAMVKP